MYRSISSIDPAPCSLYRQCYRPTHVYEPTDMKCFAPVDFWWRFFVTTSNGYANTKRQEHDHISALGLILVHVSEWSEPSTDSSNNKYFFVFTDQFSFLPMEYGKERVVALVDMDCFYVQVEQRLNPALRNTPCVVAQYKTWKGGRWVSDTETLFIWSTLLKQPAKKLSHKAGLLSPAPTLNYSI